MVPKLIPVKYQTRHYPNNIQPKIEEIPCHFDRTNIEIKMDYSLHTEYSYGKRDFKSPFLKTNSIIEKSSHAGTPILWKNEEWSKDFADFIFTAVGNRKDPHIIEIHPPFKKYCWNISDFIRNYKIFEDKIISQFPNTQIAIENRNRSRVSSDFLISKTSDLLSLSKSIDKEKLKLQIVVDFPQLLSNQIDLEKIKIQEVQDVIRPLKDIMHNVIGVHLWGRKLGKDGKLYAHQGNLDTFFHYNPACKEVFLRELYTIMDDDKARYFVPETSAQRDAEIIVNDLVNHGFEFV